MFYDILEQKKGLSRQKNKFKKSKNCDFSKRVVNGFGPKLAIFLSSFF